MKNLDRQFSSVYCKVSIVNSNMFRGLSLQGIGVAESYVCRVVGST